MKQIPERPAGLTLIALLVAANGLASLWEAFWYAELSVPGLLQSAVRALIGLFLLHRAYAIWSSRRLAWLITLVVLCTRATFATLALVASPTSVAAWIDLVLIVGATLYLARRDVRRYFSANASRE